MNLPPVSLRRFFQTTGLSLASWPLAGALLSAPAETVAQTVTPPASSALPPLNRFPRMMQDWLVEQVRAAETRGYARRDAVKTRAEAEAYVESCRARIRQAFGPAPEKTPLNAKVTRTVEREG